MDRGIKIVRQLEQVFQPYQTQLPLQCFFTEKKTRKNAETKFCWAINYCWIFYFREGGFGIQPLRKASDDCIVSDCYNLKYMSTLIKFHYWE